MFSCLASRIGGFLLLCCITIGGSAGEQESVLDVLFAAEELTEFDAVLLSSAQVDGVDQTLYEWQADKPLIPASLTKLATARLAIDKWGLDHQFSTDFYRDGGTLVVKGYGDPFLVSEELDLVADQLSKNGMQWLQAVHIDGSHFGELLVPGRSRVADPYNAPLSAVSANFNTAQLANQRGELISAEPQTPLTNTAVNVARRLGVPKRGETERVNLISQPNAERNFAEVLLDKLGTKQTPIVLGQRVSEQAALLYRHSNSRDLADILRGTLEFSNNFMANQLFVALSAQVPMSFEGGARQAKKSLEHRFGWQNHAVVEGAGLSRENRLSARQIDDLLSSLQSHQELLKAYSTKVKGASIRAKTGTLNGVRSFAGYVSIDGKDYRFVFNFNRAVPYRYREQLLERMVATLSGH